MEEMMELSKSREDYLEAICEICEEEKVARVTDIASHMSVSLASVNYALKALRKSGLIKHKRYGYIELTEKGSKIGNAIYKKHKLIRSFLINVLNVDKNIADRDACGIEHVVSEETCDKMQSYLKSREALENYDFTS
jgi:DtxR family transcriptional regulator, Mn-dependent transcriptional regulator